MIVWSPMPTAFYIWTRDLHLYLGLFVSPFLVVFAVSVFFVNHLHPSPPRSATTTATVRDLRVPGGIEQAKGMERAQLAAQILSQLGVTGEIQFIRSPSEEHQLVIRVGRPGVEATINLDVEERTAVVSEHRTAIWERLAYLHRAPGPHNVAIRGNSFGTRAWRWLADATVYLVLFLSVSGIYLWAMLRLERRAGLILLAAGALSFGGIIYAVVD